MPFYEDETDALAGFRGRGRPSTKQGIVIQFYHVATIKKALTAGVENGSQATFKAFLTAFKDNFKVNWNQKETYGRMDAIQTFKNTQRSITISFDVPSHSEEEAVGNFIELEKLIMMQYPVYESINLASPPGDGSSATTEQSSADKELSRAISTNSQNSSLQSSASKTTGRFMSAPPLLYIKFLNWVSNTEQAGSEDAAGFKNCLVGTISDVSFSPDLEQGVHIIDGKLIPKTFILDLNINIIHTEELGWIDTISNTGQKLKTHVFGDPKSDSGESGFGSYGAFPYNVEKYIYSEDSEE